ncbi:uncharacterized protein ARMOST_18500 [Armillaria ostoyae]|uniref:Uncharacterized protein n=1 Tax=Armillaria ostoyae TaxID=47428 RepID=A0A284S1Y9_ARMOS|nr:uncharacterized protein ARMOST_18500 [Armillaria ostoyae]
MLSTEIDLAEALMSVQQMSPSDWGYVSEMCMEALIRSGSPNDEQPSSPSEENSTAEDSSDFGQSSPTYPLTDTMIPSAISTSSVSDAASICSSFSAVLAEASATNCCPSFYPDVPANAMRPSISVLLSSIVSKDSDSRPPSASPISSTSDTPTTPSEDSFPSPEPSTPPQIPTDIPSHYISSFSVSSESRSVSTASRPNYYREHTYTSPPAEPVRPVSFQPVQTANILAQPTLSSENTASHELVTTIRQPPVRATRFVPYSVTGRPPTLAARALTSSSSFSFADQTFSPKPYIPSKCPSPVARDTENQSYSKVFCRKGKYPHLAATHGINDQALYYGWKADYVTCYIPGCNKEVIKNTRAEVSKHVKKFHLYAEDPQYVVRDCCPAASAADRFVKVEMVYGHFQTERHSLIHNSHQYSCGYCRDVAARPDQLDSHFFECCTLRNYVRSLRPAPPQTSFYPTSLSLGI